MNMNNSKCEIARAERAQSENTYHVPWRESYVPGFDFDAPDEVRPDNKALAASGLRRVMVRRDAERGKVEIYVAAPGVQSAGYVVGIERGEYPRGKETR